MGDDKPRPPREDGPALHALPHRGPLLPDGCATAADEKRGERRARSTSGWTDPATAARPRAPGPRPPALVPPPPAIPDGHAAPRNPRSCRGASSTRTLG